tara:strand:- start:531 stop:818 length:288 start_codon:yes stop_codon:yes gene_type:complete
MPVAPMPKPRAPLHRREMNNIYQRSPQMLDAYDNSQFRNINPEAYNAPDWELQAKPAYDRLIPIQAYQNGVQFFDHRWPQFRETVHSMKNKGRHF